MVYGGILVPATGREEQVESRQIDCLAEAHKAHHLRDDRVNDSVSGTKGLYTDLFDAENEGRGQLLAVVIICIELCNLDRQPCIQHFLCIGFEQ